MKLNLKDDLVTHINPNPCISSENLLPILPQLLEFDLCIVGSPVLGNISTANGIAPDGIAS